LRVYFPDKKMYSLTSEQSSETFSEFRPGASYDAPMKLNDRILKARTAAEMTQQQLATAVGKTRGAVAQWESGESIPRWETLDRIARATGKKPAWLVYDEEVGLKVIGEIAVGVWREANTAFPDYIGPIAAHPRFPSDTQRSWLVSDNSLGALAPRGAFLHTINLEQAGLTAHDGDIVVVHRTHDGKSEYTVRTVVETKGHQVLRTENSPDWSVAPPVAILDLVIGKWLPVSGHRQIDTRAFHDR
jgi:transcriptional regulator with XRE-family HTH domain